MPAEEVPPTRSTVALETRRPAAQRDVLGEGHRVALDVALPGPVTGSHTMPALRQVARRPVEHRTDQDGAADVPHGRVDDWASRRGR